MLDRRLIHVVAVAHTGSFTRAAEHIGISQSGITKSVGDIERELGYAIFHRTARGAMPTEAGQNFVERAVRLLDDARALLSGNREGRNPFAQSLRIGIAPASLEWLLSSVLVKLLARYPDIRFELAASTFERVSQLLRNGSIDVALGFEEAFRDWGEVKIDRVATMETDFFVRRGHPLLDLSSIGANDLVQHIIVMPSESRPYGSIIRALFRNVGESHRHIHIIDYFPTVLRVVEASNAIGVTAQQYAASKAFEGNFVRLENLDILPPCHICCAMRPGWDPPPAVRAFVHALKSEIPAQL